MTGRGRQRFDLAFVLNMCRSGREQEGQLQSRGMPEKIAFDGLTIDTDNRLGICANGP